MTQLDPRALRSAFGRFMTGVTVITALKSDGTPIGFTANSFSSVSLDPPMLLVCPGKFLSNYDAFVNCSHFAVNILSEGQKEISNIFASFKGDRFAQVAHHFDDHGVPLIDGATAHFSCATHSAIPMGDHCILIGQVTSFAQQDLLGLGYVGGQYFSLGLERTAFVAPAICGAIVECDDTILMMQTPDGLRPPQCQHADRGRLITQLKTTLAGKGITADLGQVYSVFEDLKDRENHTYFLATGTVSAPAPDVVAIPIADIPHQKYTSPAIARMMERFAIEAQTGDFALYLGDADQGAIHIQSKRK